MKKKIIKVLGSILALNILVAYAQVTSTHPVHTTNFSSENTCIQELEIIVTRLQTTNNVFDRQELQRLLKDAEGYYEQCEKNHIQHEYELFLAFKDPNDPKFVELGEKIMSAIELDPTGDKKLEELPNGDFIKRLLIFYQPNSSYYQELTPGQQWVINSFYERFKLSPETSQKNSGKEDL